MRRYTADDLRLVYWSDNGELVRYEDVAKLLASAQLVADTFKDAVGLLPTERQALAELRKALE